MAKVLSADPAEIVGHRNETPLGEWDATRSWYRFLCSFQSLCVSSSNARRLNLLEMSAVLRGQGPYDSYDAY